MAQGLSKDPLNPNILSSTEEHKQLSNLVASTKNMLKQACLDQTVVLHAQSRAKICIYRIPKTHRKGNQNAYIPQTVSLGPYHHGQEWLKDMERHKWRSLYQILHRTNHDVELYLNTIKEVEDEARACFEGSISLESDPFIQMMVVDGCFILELLRSAGVGFEKLGYSGNDHVFAMNTLMYSIQHDMLMLENQVPLFILERLLTLQEGIPDPKELLVRRIFFFFNPIICPGNPLEKGDHVVYADNTNVNPLSRTGGLHLIDVLHHRIRSRIACNDWGHRLREIPDNRLDIPCATELRAAGIMFKMEKTDCFWDIKFNKSTMGLSLPRLFIDGGTRSMLLNFIAFEESHLGSSNQLTSYVIFMNNLIKSSEDVFHLCKSGAIKHMLGSNDDVVDLFVELCQDVVVFNIDASHLSTVFEQVRKYCSKKRVLWKTRLRLDYFNNPWALISLVNASTALLISLIQTVIAVNGVRNNKDN